MHRHGTYRTINFVYPALCLVAFHPIGLFLHTPIAIYTSPFHSVDLPEEELNAVSAPRMPKRW
jgi:hypothetical protein